MDISFASAPYGSLQLDRGAYDADDAPLAPAAHRRYNARRRELADALKNLLSCVSSSTTTTAASLADGPQTSHGGGGRADERAARRSVARPQISRLDLSTWEQQPQLRQHGLSPREAPMSIPRRYDDRNPRNAPQRDRRGVATDVQRSYDRERSRSASRDPHSRLEPDYAYRYGERRLHGAPSTASGGSAQSGARAQTRPSAPPGFECKALYTCIADSADELSFREGERLWVVDANASGRLEQGWWYAENADGAAGLVPLNHLERVAGGDGARHRALRRAGAANALLPDSPTRSSASSRYAEGRADASSGASPRAAERAMERRAGSSDAGALPARERGSATDARARDDVGAPRERAAGGPLSFSPR